MAWIEPRTWVTGEVLTKANLDAQIRDNLNYLKTNIALEAAIELTIAAGVVTKTRAHHTIDTESDAAMDDLVTINGGAEGEVLLIRPSSGVRTIVLKHNTGNIWSPMFMDLSLVDADSYALLAYSGSKWCIIGAGGGSFTNLNDVPTSYAGAAGYVVVVNGTATGLQFQLAVNGIIPHSLNNHTNAVAAVDFGLQAATNFVVEGAAVEPILTVGRIYRDTSGTGRIYYCKEDL